MLLLKADPCDVALLSDTNSGRKKASVFDVAFLHKRVSSQFVESIGKADRDLCLKDLQVWNPGKTQFFWFCFWP